MPRNFFGKPGAAATEQAESGAGAFRLGARVRATTQRQYRKEPHKKLAVVVVSLELTWRRGAGLWRLRFEGLSRDEGKNKRRLS